MPQEKRRISKFWDKIPENQITFSAGSFAYDARGNLTYDAANRGYAYSGENLLTSSTPGGGGPSVSLAYDALTRLHQLSGAAVADRRLVYDGLDMIAEADGTGAIAKRYVHSPPPTGSATIPLRQVSSLAIQWV